MVHKTVARQDGGQGGFPRKSRRYFAICVLLLIFFKNNGAGQLTGRQVMGEVEVDPGVEAVRVMAGDHGVEVLRQILAELGAEGSDD
jgi:hypothetical protein